MEQQDKKTEEQKDTTYEKLRESVAETIKEGFNKMKKKEMEFFVKSLDPMMQQIDELVDSAEKQNTELKLNMFKHKIALITFNGLLITLMVGSKGKITFGLLTFILLFFSIVVGLLQIIFYYFKNEYSFIDGKIINQKLEAISALCKMKNGDENTINDAKAFIRNLMLDNKKNYDNVPALLKDIDQTYNLHKLFLKSLLIELLFFVPFIVGFALVLYTVYFYIS